MKRVTIGLNVISLAFTLFVMATDGPATKAAYVVFGQMLWAIPAFTVFALARERNVKLARVAAFLNVLLLGAVCWALVDQYPHPAEPGFVPYVLVVALTPVLSVVALLRGGPSGRPTSKVAVAGAAS
jgi:peptidoglycan/LPS O-acetylase OafA/YrhL